MFEYPVRLPNSYSLKFEDRLILDIFLFNRMGGRMQHPSSGRRNFDMVTAATNDRSSTSTQQDANPTKTAYKLDVERKTKDAIELATRSQSPTSPNNQKSDEKNET